LTVTLYKPWNNLGKRGAHTFYCPGLDGGEERKENEKLGRQLSMGMIDQNNLEEGSNLGTE
jgi:hypothetical protein